MAVLVIVTLFTFTVADFIVHIKGNQNGDWGNVNATQALGVSSGTGQETGNQTGLGQSSSAVQTGGQNWGNVPQQLQFIGQGQTLQ